MVEASGVLKIVKKALKKEDSKSMKLKALAKVVAKETGDETVSSKTLKKWIEESSKFSLDGKIVSLAGKKRSSGPESTDSSGPESTDSGVVTKKPRLITDDDSSTSSTKQDNGSVQEWRGTNKIVVKHATDDKELTDALNTESKYYPFSSFASKECQAALVPALLRQCTEGNGFTKPSPIQAQAWPILLADAETPRDIVGIAETGTYHVVLARLLYLPFYFGKTFVPAPPKIVWKADLYIVRRFISLIFNMKKGVERHLPSDYPPCQRCTPKCNPPRK